MAYGEKRALSAVAVVAFIVLPSVSWGLKWGDKVQLAQAAALITVIISVWNIIRHFRGSTKKGLLKQTEMTLNTTVIVRFALVLPPSSSPSPSLLGWRISVSMWLWLQ